MEKTQWVDITSNDKPSILLIFLIMPTIFIIFLSLFVLGPDKEIFYDISLFILIIFTIPHFGLSLSAFIKLKDKKNSLKMKIFTLFILISFLSYLYFGPIIQIILLVAMTGYQAKHYAKQSYGISVYFAKGHELKLKIRMIASILGIIFFLSNSLWLIEINGFNYIVLVRLITIGLYSFFLVLIAYTIFSMRVFYLSRKDQSFGWGFCSLATWYIWACAAKLQSLLLFTPMLHSLQYIPFIYKKNKALGKNISSLCREYLFWIIFGFLIFYTLDNFAINLKSSQNFRLIVGLILIINCMHIYIDSFIWKIRPENGLESVG